MTQMLQDYLALFPSGYWLLLAALLLLGSVGLAVVLIAAGKREAQVAAVPVPVTADVRGSGEESGR